MQKRGSWIFMRPLLVAKVPGVEPTQIREFELVFADQPVFEVREVRGAVEYRDSSITGGNALAHYLQSQFVSSTYYC